MVTSQQWLDFGDVAGSAIIDASGQYRYLLRRRWAPHGRTVLWIMLNPSTADATENDPTVRRCIGFARTWGYAALAIVNLFARRTKDPRHLVGFTAPEAIGPDNDGVIRRELAEPSLVIAAWGNLGWLHDRDAAVVAMIGARSLSVLGRTDRGHPRHPLYLPRTAIPEPWG